MKKIIYFNCFFVFLFFSQQAFSQVEYKLAMSSGTLRLVEVDKVIFKGHSGSEVIFQTEAHHKKKNERSKGLRSINSLGLTDNSGIGLAIKQEGSDYIVDQISKNSSRKYTILVPKGISIYYEHSTHNGGKIRFENLSNEIEVSANYNSIYLEDVTGPMAINTVYGKIEGHFGNISQDGSISLHSVYGLVDVGISSAAKATVRLNTSYGEMFTDLDLEVEKTDSMRKISSSKITGSLNGGGVDLNIKATYDNIYLRAKN